MREFITIAQRLDEDVRVREITTTRQFQAALKRSNWLRAFIDTEQDVIFAWDAEAAVHPDVRRETGDFGIPVQMNARQILLRPHGLPIVYTKQMYRELIASPVIRRVYGGTLPEIRLDDEYETSYDRLNDLGWETKDDSDLDAEGPWRSMWSSY